MRGITWAIALGLVLTLAGCASTGGTESPGTHESQPAPQQSEEVTNEGACQANEEEVSAMRLSINGVDVDVEWEDNQAVADLMALASDGPVTISLSMYGGFEQVGPIGASLAASDEQVMAKPGDIVLYAGNQISIFYGTNTWAYTRLGHITDRTADEMADLLGSGNASITITVA